MTTYRNHLRDAVEATVIHSPTMYSWFKKRSPKFPQSVRRALTPQTARDYLHFALQSQLYNDFYCPGFAQPARFSDPVRPTTGDAHFVEALAAANSGQGYWTQGWDVQDQDGDRVLVHRQGLSLWAGPGDYVTPDGKSPVQGEEISLRSPKESIALSPGFYLAHGNDDNIQQNGEPVIRWYWNLSAPDAVSFMRRCTERLNGHEVPFKLKVLNDPVQYTRCDAVVLYTRKADFGCISGLLAEIYAGIATDIKPWVPMFTRQLAPGVGLAEDPAQGESFGLHRCGFVAEGMILAFEQQEHSIADRLEIVLQTLVHAGIRPDMPYLTPGSDDAYDFSPVASRKRPNNGRSGKPLDHLGKESFVEAALGMGTRLVRDAIWHAGKCNWLGAEPEGHVLGGGTTQMTYTSLGPELYSGTSGVAVFLADLHVATGDRAARETAIGALRQAISNLDAIPPAVRMGLYSGWPGVAFAAVRAGTLLDAPELVDGAQDVLTRVFQENPSEDEYDVIAGMAGGVIALVALHGRLKEAALLDFAVRLGDKLLDAADTSGGGYSWGTPSVPDQPNLTGFSHGAAGIAHALIELFGATQDPRYRRAAELAFDFERSLFDEKARNWPDLRTEPGQSADPTLPPSFATAWCHGAPGIALSRLQAFRCLGNDIYKDEALVALQSTYDAVDRSLQTKTGNFTLCHGQAGNAEILLQGSHALGEDTFKGESLARVVASSGIRHYGGPGKDWPCGPGGEKPSLMVGLAGIGHFFLRLNDPALPSVLMVTWDNL